MIFRTTNTQKSHLTLTSPNKLFRRVRDERGVLQLSKAAKGYHPGRGVYRSSYKNARRLAATETNIAYRTSDHLRWQQADYVVGIEVKLSNNHTVRLQPGETTADPTQLRKDGTPKANAVRPLHDICDELQGRYPKDFKFTGWHPHCRCYAISILKTEKERLADLKRIARGEPLNSESVNAVHDTPEAFNEWVKNNADRINQSKSLPYFIRDNQQRVNRLLGKEKTPQEIAKERHAARTSEGVASVQRRWEQRLIRNLSYSALEINVYDDFYSKHISLLRASMNSNDVEKFKTQYENAVRAMKNLRNKIVGAVIPYTPHAAMKTEYKTLEEVRKSLKTIGDEKAWFPTGRMSILESAQMNANGSSNRKLGRIRLTSERSNLVRTAMEKIGKGKSWTITKEEADAMATLWHEMNHQMHIGDEIPGLKNSKSRSYMELANEFVSRKTLPDFYKSFGCKTTPYPGFIERRTTTGYDDMVCRYQYAIDAGKLNLGDVVSSVRNGLLNSPYDKQKKVLIDGLIAGGMKGRGTDIAKLVEMCESEATEEAILKFMKENGLIQSGSNP